MSPTIITHFRRGEKALLPSSAVYSKNLAVGRRDGGRVELSPTGASMLRWKRKLVDAQMRHNQAFQASAPRKVADRATLEASLRAKNGPSMEPPLPARFDPIASAMKRHPGLTSEKAAEMAADFGF